jgi:protein-disulfide isomerase
LNLKTPALLAAVAALLLAGCQKTEDAAFGAKVRAYLLAHPEVLQEMATALDKKQQVELAKATSANIARFRSQLERDPRDLVVNPNGTITVVEFFDYNCGYCKHIAPEVVKLVQENPDVRFVFKEFAFQTPASVEAAKVALTPAGKARGLDLYRELMARRPLNSDTIDQSLVAAGVDIGTARKAAADPAIQRQLLDVQALTQAMRIEGTPAFIIGDVMVPGADIDALREAIAQAKARARRGGSAT